MKATKNMWVIFFTLISFAISSFASAQVVPANTYISANIVKVDTTQAVVNNTNASNASPTIPAPTDSKIKVDAKLAYLSDYVTDTGVSYDTAIYRFDLSLTIYDIRFGVTKIGNAGSGNSIYAQEYRIWVDKTWYACDGKYLTVGFRHEFIKGPWDLDIPLAEGGWDIVVNDKNKLKLFIRTEYWRSGQIHTDNGFVFTGGAEWTHKVTDKLDVGFGVYGVHNGKIQGGPSGNLLKLKAMFGYDITKYSKISATAEYYMPEINGPRDARKDEFVGGISVETDVGKQGSQIMRWVRNRTGSDD